MNKHVDLTGKIFGRLVVIKQVPKPEHLVGKFRYWECICECLETTVVTTHGLVSGNSQSCGCARTKHGTTKNGKQTREYRAWNSAIQRCVNPNDKRYKDYGGRGIKVCDRWLHSFENFLEDMGRCPEKHSLDRINNDDDYCPENCRWATSAQQARNHRRNIWIEFDNEKLVLKDMAKKIGISYQALLWRLANWSFERALTQKKQMQQRRNP
jgi:hypothetical protein